MLAGVPKFGTVPALSLSLSLAFSGTYAGKASKLSPFQDTRRFFKTTATTGNAPPPPPRPPNSRNPPF